MQRPADVAGAALRVQRAGVCQGVRIERQHAVEPGAGAVEGGDACQVRLRQRFGRRGAGGHRRLLLAGRGVGPRRRS